MSIVNPRWRAIDEFPGFEVSEEGEVRCWVYRGEVRNEPRRVTPYLHASNRWTVKIKNKTRHIAHLVLYAFRGGPDPKTEIEEACFLDGDPYNCHLSNLAWRIDINQPTDLLP